MSETDDTIATARATIDRVRGRPLEGLPERRAPRRRRDTLAFRAAAIGGVNAAILLAAVVVGMIVPLGLFGALAVLMLMIAATLLIALAPVARTKVPAPETLRQTDLKALPRQTGRWLAAQRPALPAPAVTLVDQIGVRLDTLDRQLASLPDDAPAAAEVRKLVGEQLPDFVRGYARVPENLRQVPRNGKTPDAQLVDGLRVIEQEIGDMSAQLAQGDLDQLATRGRYLEIKYRADEGQG